nr:hypothetical protein [Nocardiopsis sp. Huas11]
MRVLSGTVVLITVLVAAAVAAVLIAAYFRLLPAWRGARLRKRFGPEYDAAVAAAQGDRSVAERELDERLRRHRQTSVRTLTDAERDGHTRSWSTVQEGFVDDPAAAVGDARALVERIMTDLGYPDRAGGFEDRLRDLSVEHAHAVAEARRANVALSPAEQADTEHLREALVACRGLVTALLGTPPPTLRSEPGLAPKRPKDPAPEATR